VDEEIEKAFTKERALMKAREKKDQALIPLDLDGYLLGVYAQSAENSGRPVSARFPFKLSIIWLKTESSEGNPNQIRAGRGQSWPSQAS
jgi:hypothetical protein